MYNVQNRWIVHNIKDNLEEQGFNVQRQWGGKIRQYNVSRGIGYSVFGRVEKPYLPIFSFDVDAPVWNENTTEKHKAAFYAARDKTLIEWNKRCKTDVSRDLELLVFNIEEVGATVVRNKTRLIKDNGTLTVKIPTRQAKKHNKHDIWDGCITHAYTIIDGYIYPSNRTMIEYGFPFWKLHPSQLTEAIKMEVKREKEVF